MVAIKRKRPIAPYCGLTLGIGALLAQSAWASLPPNAWKVKLAECMFSCESRDTNGDGRVDDWVCDDRCPAKVVANPCGPGAKEADQLDERTWECRP